MKGEVKDKGKERTMGKGKGMGECMVVIWFMNYIIMLILVLCVNVNTACIKDLC